MVLVVALVASAAAAAGPAYYNAAKTSILQDTAASATPLQRGFEVVQSGAVADAVDPLLAQVEAVLASRTPGVANAGATPVAALFQRPVEAEEATAYLPGANSETIPLVWRSDFCAHLALQGSCATQPGQVVISRSLAGINHWQVGQRVAFPVWGSLTVTGIYRMPDVNTDYWFDRGGTYFPFEIPPSSASRALSASYDAMFTPRGTLDAAPANVSGTAVIDDVVDLPALRLGDVARLQSEISGLVNSAQLTEEQVVVTSELPNTLATVRAAWSSLAVPVLLITVQLLGLTWLLLFLVVTGLAEARGPEVALAKLRGYGR
jgi:hypothetical protein